MSGIGELFGGLLEGGGSAMQAQGKAEREAAYKRLEMDHEEQLREQGAGVEHGYRMSEEDNTAANQAQNQDANTRLTYGLMGDNQKTSDERNHTNRLGEIEATGAQERQNARLKSELDDKDIDKIITLDDNTQVAVMKDGSTKALTDPGGKPIKIGGDITSGEARELAIQKQRHTTIDELTQEKTIDWDAIDKDLRKSGRTKLADKLSGAPPPSVGLPQGDPNSADSANYDGIGERGAVAKPAKLPAGMTPQAALAQARDAIKGGKDRNAVIQRLKSYGVDPSGL